jgi:muramoyltetrapeptide carboxypeptidase LdcA involved in peptidoglycan recycling
MFLPEGILITMKFIKPRRLQAGDTVAAISLSSGLAGMFPQAYETAKKNLEDIYGLKVISTPHALKDPDWIYQHPKERAEDLYWALENSEVKGIISMIGGYESVRILPYLNPDLICKHPKIFVGFSDTTIQHMAFLNAGVTSFYGPSMLGGIAYIKAYPYMLESIRQTLFEGYTGTLQPAPFWSETFLDWASPDYANKAHLSVNVQQSEGWIWLQGNKRVEGYLIGGCIEVLEMLKGTQWWPKPELFEGAVLYLESSEEAPPVSAVEYWLRNYASQGILEKILGLMLARPAGYSLEMKEALYKVISKVLVEVGREDLPVVANMDIGHTTPMMVVPNGCRVAIDPKGKIVELLEAGVS